MTPIDPPLAAPAVTPTTRVARRLASREPVAYAIALRRWTVWNVMPIPAGLLLKAVLDRVAAGPDRAGGGLLVALAVVEVGRWAVFGFAVVQWHGCWVFWNTLPADQHAPLAGAATPDRSSAGSPAPAARR